MSNSVTFQKEEIQTAKTPSWDDLRDKMKYVMRRKGTDRVTRAPLYQVVAYAKHAMRKPQWRELFGLKTVIKVCHPNMLAKRQSMNEVEQLRNENEQCARRFCCWR